MLPVFQPAWLILEDGSVWPGQSIGAQGQTTGELVFNTAMTGYQEILTDPSYRGQVVMMTYPEIGNYGMNTEDVESNGLHAAGFVVRKLSRSTSSWRAAGSLSFWLKEAGIVGIEGVDTRALTRRIREHGSLKCGITTDGSQLDAFLEQVKTTASLDEQDLVGQVTPGEVMTFSGTREDNAYTLKRLVAVDFGMKANILRCLQTFIKDIIVVPATTSFEEIHAYNPDAVFLSNGPGDPRRLDYAIQMAKRLIDNRVPTFGICLGHQLLSLALGLQVEKMRFGHHGGNHPVLDKELNTIAITSQNHGYCVVETESAVMDEVDITHINLNDDSIEGFRHKKLPVSAVQFHPEAAPGPRDAQYLFERFLTTLTQRAASSAT